MPLRNEKARRLVQAVLENIDKWQVDLAEIESFAIPGNKARILHLMASMEQAKRSLLHIVADYEQLIERGTD